MKIQQFDYSIDIEKALLWQYNEAKNIEKLVLEKQSWIDINQEKFWNDWYTDVFNLVTANEFGLAVWSIILDIPLLIQIDQSSKISWGFEQYRKNFDNGNFDEPQGGIILTLEEQRLILRLRYFQFVNRGAAIEINAFLKIVFEQFGNVYVLDGLDMTITYVFQFIPSTSLLLALQQYDLLPRPACVGINYVISMRETWGFDQYHKNFDNGTFGT